MVFFLVPLALPAVAVAEVPVDLELVLAVDVSGSIDSFEARQQREGYELAIRDPAVIEAIRGNFRGRIAVTYVEWGGAEHQRVVIPWRVVEDAASGEAFAAVLAAAPQIRSMYTSISEALAFAAPLFRDNGYAGDRRVIDVSGDGPNNRGRPLETVRRQIVDQGITINGLPILNDRPQPYSTPTPLDARLDLYYEQSVIGGPGAFIVPAEDFTAFRTAILTKLIREVAGAAADRTLAAR
jgi:hypothetical protein